jgi:hypothetical protein
MQADRTNRTAFSISGLETGTAPFAITARRLFGLDVGDWSIVLLGLALVGSLLSLV